MKRFRFLVLAVLSIALFACGGKGKTGEKVDESLRLKKTGKEGNLVFMMWGDPAEKTAVFKVLQEFQKENDIGLEVIHVDSLSYSDKLLAMYAGDSPPDVFYLHKQDFYNYASKGLLYNLDDYTSDADFNIKDFYPELIDAFTFGNSLYGVPKDWTSFVLYYNMDMFDKAGIAYPNENWTWNDFTEACKKLAKDNNGDGVIDQYGFMIETWADWYYAWIKQNGGEIFDKDGNWVFAKGKYLDKNAEAIQFLADLINKYKVAPDVATSKQLGNYESFMSGRAAMCMYGRWAELKFKDIKNFKWAYTTLPKKEKKASTVVTVSLAISSKTGQQGKADIAWKLLKYITSYKGQVFTAESGQAVPSRRSLVNSESYLAAPEVIKHQPHLKMAKPEDDPFIKSLEFAAWPPANAYWLEVRNKLDEQLEDVFLGNKDAKSVIMRIDTIVNDIISGSSATEVEGSEE